jgi:uncharacterized protein (DUF433 family)
MQLSCVVSNPEILGGTPVFIGTRVPVRTLFEHLAAGNPLGVFLKEFPSVSRELAVQALEDAKNALVRDALSDRSVQLRAASARVRESFSPEFKQLGADEIMNFLRGEPIASATAGLRPT